MKRRKKLKILPINRCLLFSEGVPSVPHDETSLPEKLGLKPVVQDKLQPAKPEGLVHWLNAPRFPQWHPAHPLARIFAMAARNNHPMTFRYHGGSTPGAKRTVYPAEVFTVGWGDALYVSGWCMDKQAHRTFRIDRIELPG